ncbi:MAG: WbqC family protein [Desulforegulaceae bacterium]|nr:WbqC family protein [Desulforegulaceae bacterium]
MKLGIMQPYFFPYIGYWQLLNYVDTYVVYDDVNFIKGGWINRNYILSNGDKLLLILNLKQASPNKHINEIDIGKNQKKILKTLFQSYSKAPYFNSVCPLIEDIFSTKEQNLALFLLNSIQKIVEFLKIKTKIVLSSEIDKNNALKGQDKVLEICSKLGADTYVNALGGMALYDSDVFKKNNIDLYFLKPLDFEYQQFSGAFEKNLSIMDVLMFNSLHQIKLNLHDFKLVKGEK